MASCTREMLSSETRPAVLPFATSETVAVDTPARAATMAAVIRRERAGCCTCSADSIPRW